jgi:hypothetical protein
MYELLYIQFRWPSVKAFPDPPSPPFFKKGERVVCSHVFVQYVTTNHVYQPTIFGEWEAFIWTTIKWMTLSVLIWHPEKGKGVQMIKENVKPLKRYSSIYYPFNKGHWLFFYPFSFYFVPFPKPHILSNKNKDSTSSASHLPSQVCLVVKQSDSNCYQLRIS